MILFSGVIQAPPRTKKNHSRIIRAGGFPRLLPSEAYEAFEAAALPQLRKQFSGESIAVPVNCKAIFLRLARSGDAVGYYQALGDILQKAGVVVNDKFIVSWDGSRLDKDAKNPRVIFTLEAVA